MELLERAIYTTPIIDHHCHNLLILPHAPEHDLLSITSEAQGDALQGSVSALANIRAVKQLSKILGCSSTWDDVRAALQAKHKDYVRWAKQCFDGIETALIDDGLASGPQDVHPYAWHNTLTRSSCKRIVRIEKVAEDVVTRELRRRHDSAAAFKIQVTASFLAAIEDAIIDPEVVGFKSVICYRTGLAIRDVFAKEDVVAAFERAYEAPTGQAFRLQDDILSPRFVRMTAVALVKKASKKPFQFHTGLGDNDIILDLSNPAHMQPFIEEFSKVNIVLLHASYPFTTEAGYLASVYSNVYLDIGEVFPFLR